MAKKNEKISIIKVGPKIQKVEALLRDESPQDKPIKEWTAEEHDLAPMAKVKRVKAVLEGTPLGISTGISAPLGSSDLLFTMTVTLADEKGEEILKGLVTKIAAAIGG